MGDKKAQTLKKLRKLGLVHIEITEGHGPKIGELQRQISLLESSIYTVGEQAKKNADRNMATIDEALAYAQKIASLSDEKSERISEQAMYTAELDRISAWGDIDPDKFAELTENGISLSLYELPISELEKSGEELRAIVLEKSKSSAKVLLVSPEDTLPEALKSCKLELPKLSTEELRGKLSACNRRIKEIDDELFALSSYTDNMKDAIKALQKDIKFETYATGMTDESLSDSGSYKISYFVGYTEAENVDTLVQAAKENSWGLLVEEPTEEDNVPTKLKNNKFVSLIYPLTDFLGTVPGYFEYDISAWFLGFILIFFGIIFGDGGYGLFILGVVAVPIIKALISKKPVSPLFLLVGLFGLSTILWGTLTCTWFGLDATTLPVWLQKLSIPVISNVYADKIWYPFWTNGEAGLTTSQNVQILCFSLALVQLSVAHVKNALRNRGSIKLLGDVGSILQLIGIFYLVLSLVVNGAVFSFGLVIGGIPVGTVAIALIGIGFVMGFVFSNYEGSIGKSILASLKDIVSVLLGVINVFSDIVSYIRLWAVGLAGAAISATVNDLVSPFFGNLLMMIIAIVVLVFGHGLNMILNVLSVIVHGIRLNTLEFSSHLNMSWSGHKYEPFEE